MSKTAAAVQPSQPRATSVRYPPAPRGNVVEVHHGVQVADPYRVLEQMDSAETKAWVTAENRLTDSYLADIPGRDALHARIAELMRFEMFGLPRHRGGRYFWTYNDGKHEQRTLHTALSLAAPPKLLVDPNVISSDGSLAFAGFVVAETGGRVAYGLSAAGGDWQEWHVVDVASGKELPDKLEYIKYYAPAFTRDGNGIYYSRFPAPPPGKDLLETDHDCKVYFHKLGTPAAQDVVVYERPEQPTWQFDPQVTDDGRYLVIAIGDGEVGDRMEEQIVYIDLAVAHKKPVPLIDRYEADYVFLGNDGPVFFLKTTFAAPNKKIIAIDTRKPERESWKDIVPEGTHAIDSAELVGHQIVVTTLEDAHGAATRYGLAGKKLGAVALPGLGHIHGFNGPPDARETFYSFMSFTVPGTIYRFDLATGRSSLWKEPSLSFDRTVFETKQVFYPSRDGTMIPMFITAKKGIALDGNNPTLLTGYGGGGVPNTPYFDPAMIAWLERGGVLALANIRGGGEYGEAWHRASMRERRQVGLDDFIAAGEWLVGARYTSTRKLGVFGRSGGGLLVAAAEMQKPELFGAAAPLSGVYDLLRFQLFGEGAGWQGDMGSPDNPNEFRALYAYSPLHNVRAGTRYPATFIVTADHDVRVAPLHSYKFAAGLQSAQAGDAPILLRVDTKTGHGTGPMLTQKIDQETEFLAFFARHLGLQLK
ncbi:MAG TPA: prolyl oligopeptidase family serine peptidase [Candidatus Polarisedimenticolia bacterium]|nr:prolyl oligopeptidase family serine peptidase [Candidatus Polarisedimenticolia bacterium]